jgi:CHAT domain-containing protein/tetratricopeptide (TPR) repeat protein
MRTRLVFIACLALVTEAHAQNQADQESLRADVWERILARLEALPDRWDALPAPAVPPLGRSPDEVLSAATEAEKQAARQLISDLALSPPEARAQIMARARQQRALSEVDLWFPLFLARDERLRDIDQAGLTVDAWLDLAAQLGRRDVLLGAAGFALYLATSRILPTRLAAVARRWSILPPEPNGTRGAASVNEAHGRILYFTGRNSEALDAHRNARQLYRGVGDKQGQGNSWVGEAEVLFLLGNNQGALSAYRQARSLYQDVGDMLGQGHSWKGEAEVLFRLGNNQGALSAYRQARSLFQDVGDKPGQGNSWVGEALVLSLLGNKQGALSAYRQARSLFHDVGSKRGQGNSWFGEAEELLLLGNKQGALSAYRQARSLYQDVGDTLGQGNSWVGEALVLFELGNNQGALSACRQARSLLQDVGEKLGQGHSWWGEAEVLFRLGNNQGALSAYRQARSLYQDVGAKLGQGNSWFGEAEVLFRLGNNQGALSAYRQARSLYQGVGAKLGQGNSWVGEAEVLFRLGNNQGALSAYRQARSLYQEVGNKQGQGVSWRGEADVLFRLDEHGRALRAADNAVQLARDMGSIPNELNARTSEMRILLAGNQQDQAIQSAEDALALLRDWRRRGVADLDRTAMANWASPYDLLIPLLARKRGPAVEKALALAEEAHAPVLLDLLAAGSRRPEDTSDLSLREERKRLLRERAELDRRLQDTIAPGERERLRREREAVDTELELNELRALGTLDSTFENGKPINAKTRDALVREGGPILLYYVAEDETVAFLLQPGQRAPLVRRIGLSRGQLQDEVRALRHELANPLWKARAHARQRAFFDQLVAPFADVLAASPRVTIIPHGPLHELPFEALLDADDRPLFERWHVTVAPSLSALHALRHRHARRRPSPNQSAFLGIAGGTGLSLPYREINEVGTWFGPTARIIAQQTDSRGAYAELAPDARHILISSHGKHVGRSRSGYLELTAPGGVATRLTASAIAHIPLRADLVTLAACETARGEAMQSDERLDLTRAFLIAGADAVLATRWRVPEHPSTRQFLLDFYQALHQGGPGGTRLRKDEALTEARRRSRARGDHDQLWAAWVLVGDAR